MNCLEITLDGRKYVAGLRDGVFSVMVNHANRRGEVRHSPTVRLAGLDSDKHQHVHWLKSDFRMGSTLMVRLVDAEASDPPIGSHASQSVATREMLGLHDDDKCSICTAHVDAEAVTVGVGRICSSCFGAVLVERAEPSAVYDIYFHNDDVTTQDFVADMLNLFFGLSTRDADELMMRVDTEGKALVGSFDLKKAQGVTADIVAAARRKGFPLRVTFEARPVAPMPRT